MKREVFEIDDKGHIAKVFHAEFDIEGNPLEELAENVITIQPQGLYIERWTGAEWVEGMPQAEIDALDNVPKEPTDMETLRLEQASANAELFEMMLMLTGGVS